MSEAALKALESRAQGAEPPASARAQALADLSARAAGKTAPPAEKPRKGFAMPSGRMPTARAPDVDPRRAEAALQAGTGAIGTTIGGLTGLGAVIAGEGADQAAEHVNWWQQALTYQPRTAVGQDTAEQLGAAMESPANPLTWPGRFGEEFAETGEELGLPPGALTVLRLAPEAAAGFLGAPGKAASAARASLMEDVQAARAAIPRAVEKLTDVREPDVSENPFERESLGAAAAVPSQLKSASPDLQAAVRAEAREGGVNREALDRHLEADSLPIPMRLTKGQATQDPVQISEEMNKRAKGDAELVRVFNRQNQELIDNLDEIRRETSPNVVGNDHIQNGQALIDAYKTYDDAVRADIAAKYQALRDANGGNFPVDGQAFVASADAALKKNMKGRYVPSQIAADLEEIRAGGPMNFETFENLRTNLAAEGRKAERAGDGNAAAAINIVRESLEDLPLTGDAAKLKPIADEARKAAKARFDRLRADPAYRAAADDPVAPGEASALADDFVQRFVVKGKAANIQRMQETLSADPTAGETIAAGALNYLKAKSGVNLYTNEGNFSQAGFNRALSEVNPKLEALVGPQRAEQVRTLGNVARYTMVRPKGAYVNESNTFVAAAKEKALSAAEMAINTTVFPGAGLGTRGRGMLEKQAEKKFVKEATKPGAGLKLKDAPKEETRD